MQIVHYMRSKLTHLHACLISLHLCSQVYLTDNLEKLSRILETDHFALVVHDHIQCKMLYLKHFFKGSTQVSGNEEKEERDDMQQRSEQKKLSMYGGRDGPIHGVNVIKLLLFSSVDVHQCWEIRRWPVVA